MAIIPITIDTNGNPSPSDPTCNPDDTITWSNQSGVTIQTFTLPQCVTPQNSPAPFASGSSASYTVKKKMKGNSSYSYMFPNSSGVPDSGQDLRNAALDVQSDDPIPTAAAAAASSAATPYNTK